MPYYGYYYGADLGYYAVVLASLVLGGLAQAFIKSTYRKWSNVSATILPLGSTVSLWGFACAAVGAQNANSTAVTNAIIPFLIFSFKYFST